MRFVVTGAHGGLARAFLARIPSHHEVHAFDHAALDVGDHDAVRQRVEALRPDVVVNLAAFTQVDANELDPLRAARDNAMGPQNLALAARSCGAVLVHTSTDFVFDGTKGSPYDELDPPAPLSVYGRAKLAGEGHVRALIPEHFILRVGYVYGGGADHLTAAARALAAGRPAGGLSDRVGSPTYVHDLAERILPVLLSGRFGTYHLGGPEPSSWFEMVTRVRSMGGFSGEVRRQTAAELRLVAPRPAYSALTSVYLPALGVEPMPALEDSLKRFLAGLPGAG